jgi:hypothetical protein
LIIDIFVKLEIMKVLLITINKGRQDTKLMFSVASNTSMFSRVDSETKFFINFSDAIYLIL